MIPQRFLHGVLLLIAAATCLTGLTQIVAAGVVLELLGADSTAISRHFFAIIGMFMALFGGATLHTLTQRSHSRVVLLWAGLQKLGASLAVGIGVWHHLFSGLGWLVAAFDLLTASLIALYLENDRREAQR